MCPFSRRGKGINTSCFLNLPVLLYPSSSVQQNRLEPLTIAWLYLEEGLLYLVLTGLQTRGSMCAAVVLLWARNVGNILS